MGCSCGGASHLVAHHAIHGPRVEVHRPGAARERRPGHGLPHLGRVKWVAALLQDGVDGVGVHVEAVQHVVEEHQLQVPHPVRGHAGVGPHDAGVPRRLRALEGGGGGVPGGGGELGTCGILNGQLRCGEQLAPILRISLQNLAQIPKWWPGNKRRPSTVVAISCGPLVGCNYFLEGAGHNGHAHAKSAKNDTEKGGFGPSNTAA